jgi:hypothetical protein
VLFLWVCRASRIALAPALSGPFAPWLSVPQIGLPPRRIDLLTSLSGVTYDEAIASPVRGHVGAQEVKCIGLDAMIRNKRASGRTKDLADAEVLEELRARVAAR